MRSRGSSVFSASAPLLKITDTSLSGGRLEWWCLKWNQRALNFYEGIGAKQMDEWVSLRVDGEDLPKLADMKVETKQG